jgi:6-phosphogluconolactonase (cycloisomerase 2 family)
MKMMKAWVRPGYAGFLTLTAMLSGCGQYMPVAPVVKPAPQNSPSPQFLYVANGISSTVSGFSIDAASGALTPVGPAVAADEGSIYLAASPNGKFVYVANAETNSSSVSAYTVNAATGVLTPTMPAAFKITGDTQPFGITVDRTSSHVYTTNFNSISAFNIDRLTGALSDVPGTPVLLTKDILPQSLTFSPNGQFLYMTGGATNKVYAFSINADGLPVTTDQPVAAGTFPIGIVAEPSGKFVYVVNWISDDVSRYTITPGTGALVPASATTSLGRGCGPQELAVDPSSKFLFVSCPGFGSIAQLAIDPSTGALTPLPVFSISTNAGPRGIAVDASGMFVYSALQSLNRASGSAIGATGELKAIDSAPATGRDPLGVAIASPGRGIQ